MRVDLDVPGSQDTDLFWHTPISTLIVALCD